MYPYCLPPVGTPHHLPPVGNPHHLPPVGTTHHLLHHLDEAWEHIRVLILHHMPSKLTLSPVTSSAM